MTAKTSKSSYSVTEMGPGAAAAIRRARDGKTVVVTANGQPVAQIIPILTPSRDLARPRMSAEDKRMLARLIRNQALIRDELLQTLADQDDP